nr:zinc finger FYVE domain-containing protein 26-like [Lytechinus pictus]
MMATSGQHVPDCSKGSGVHPFGHEVSVTRDQLLTAFFNHLYLGQWELASACASSLENLQGTKDQVDIRAVLRAIVRHPHGISLGLDSISSPHQLAWLASLHLKQDNKKEEDLSAEDYRDVEFRLLLYLAHSDSDPAVLQEVYMYSKAVQLQLDADHQKLVQKQSSLLPHLSKDCLKFLLSTLSKDVTLGHTIIRRLLLPTQDKVEENNLALHRVYVTCLMECMVSLESMDDRGSVVEKDQKVQSIYSLLNYLDPPASLLPRLHIEELFTKLLGHHPGMLDEAMLTAVFLGQDSDLLLQTFLKVQSHMRWECVEQDVSKRHPQLESMCQELRINYAMSRMDDREAAWRNLLYWVLENDQHVLSKIVELSLTLIRERMYDELNSLLQPSEFAPLRPLILLLGWTHVDGCSAAENLLQTLWKKKPMYSEDDALQQACHRLHHDVQLIQWCLDKVKPLIAKYDGDLCLEQKATAMFQGSDSHSVLRLLYHFTDLSKIDHMEGLQILNSTPQLEWTRGSNGDEAKTVRFADSKERVDQKRDCTIYRSFLAMWNVTFALLHSANPMSNHKDRAASSPPAISVVFPEDHHRSRTGTTGTVRNGHLGSADNASLETAKSVDIEDDDTSWQTCVVGRLRSAKEQIAEIIPLTYRVEIIENLFSVLFARYEDIQTLESDAMMSDSGGEEGHVDEEWNNMSFNTSLESVESPLKEGSLLTEFTFSTILEKNSPVSVDQPVMNGPIKDRTQNISEDTLTPTIIDNSNVLKNADMHQLKYGKRTSSETTNSLQSYLNHFESSVNKVGFITNRRFMQELLTMLKECIEDVNTAKLANIVSKGQSKGSSDETLQSHLLTSVPQAHLAQRIAQLTKRINEARWRFQLVSSHQANVDDEDKFDEKVEEEAVIKTFFEARSDENREEKKKRKRTSSKQNGSRSRSASGWSSSEPGSGNMSTQSQTHLSAGPMSAGNSSGTERRKRRKHKKCSSHRGSISPKPFLHHDSSIVAQMLASEDTLLRMCLRRGNFAQAQQVIKIFDMKDKPEVSEVHFASHWQQAVRKLKILDKSKKGSSSSSTVTSTQQPKTGGRLGSIASIAAAGIASLSLSGVIDDLLNSSTLPMLPQIGDISRGVVAGASPASRGGSSMLWQQLNSINISSMIIFDLACTASHSWKTCSELLDVAMSRLNMGPVPEHGSPGSEVKLTSSSQVVSSPKLDQSQSLLGISAFIEQLHNLINPISSSSTALIRSEVLEYFQRCALDALTTVSAPLEPSTLRAHVNFVLEVRRGLELMTKALQAYQADEECGLAELSLKFGDSPKHTSSPKRGARHPSPKQSPTKTKTKQKVSDINHSVHQLLIALDKNVMPSFMMAFPKNRRSDDQPVNPANYLLTLYNHLNVLASLAQDAQGWQPGSERQLKVERDLCQNPFSILAESPSLLLGRLMFANQIPPVRLESVASELRLNLIQIIMQSCCPAIPMMPHSSVIDTPAPPHTVDNVTVLNEGGVAGEWPHPVRRPCVVVEELLTKIISLMMKHVSGEGSDAAFELSSAAGACSTPEYWDIVMSTRELKHVDMDLLQTNEDKLCFFTNLFNLMLAHAALHHATLQMNEKGNTFTLGHTRHYSLGRGTTNPGSIMLTSPGINSGMVLDQLSYLSSMAYRVGQMGVISAFDLHYVILRSSLPVPLVFGDILQHRLHVLGEDDPWLKYIPSPDSRITFVFCNGSASSPRLRVLRVDDLDEQLTLAMQNHLEAGVRVDEKLNQIIIPQSLEWFRKDFTGSTLPANVDHGNIYMGLLRVITPHVSQYLGDKLEDYTMKYLPRHIELESKAELVKGTEDGADYPPKKKPPFQRSNSMRFKIMVTPYDRTFRYRFYGPSDNAAQPLTLKRRLSVPDNFDSSGLGWSLIDAPAAEPPFSMTEPTLKYLHSKSKLVASLAGVVSAGIGENTDAFAKDKSIDEDMLSSSVGSPASLVFEDTFGSDRTYNPKLSTMTKVLQHLAGYPIMQYYVQSFFSEVLSIAGSSKGNDCLDEKEVRASLLADTRSKEVLGVLKEAVELLVSSCQWEAVMKLVDTIHCLGGTESYTVIRDFAAYCAGNQVKAGQMTSCSKPTWQCLLTVRNKILRDRAVLASLDSLPIEDALELLECCVLDNRKDSPLNNILHTKFQQLKMYRKITFYAMQYSPPLSLGVLQGGSTPSDLSEVIRPLCTWQDVQDASKTSPDSVLKLLMSASDFDLAKDWAELHGVIDDYQQTILVNQLEHLLCNSCNNLQVYQILEDVCSSEETIAICTQLLESQKIALPSVVFLVHYLLHNCLDELSLERAGGLHDISIGAKVLLCLPERVRGEYQHIMSRPDLLLEQLLMNLKMNLASDVQATLQEELQSSCFPSASLSENSINTLISKYAREAIQIPVALLNTSLSDFVVVNDSCCEMGDLPESHYKGQSPGLTSPGLISPPSRRTSRDGQNSDQLVSPPSSATRPPPLPEVPEKPPGVSVEGGELPAVPPTRDQWVPDDKVSNCMVCQDRFSMFNRRHHCRRCGRVVCWKCSQLRAVVDGYGDTPVRICDQCYERFIAPRSYGTPQALEQRMKGKMSDIAFQEEEDLFFLTGGRGGVDPVTDWRLSLDEEYCSMVREDFYYEQVSILTSRSLTPSQPTPVLGMGGEGLTEYGPVTDWRLSLDEEYCSMVREDFYYEQAPSTSLCLSILELHSDPGACGHLILLMCQRLSEYLRPVRPGEPNTEVDYSLVLSMMRTLLLNSKLKFLGSGDSASLELCDTYLGHVDLLNMFVSNNCTDIPSIQQLTQIDTARRIRDKLVLSERLSLAMEVSTKCGLDPGAVWAAWGLSCLQAGDYEGAREKLSKILKTPTDRNQTQGPNKLLQEIIKILESSAGQTIKVQDILTLSASSIKDFISQPYKIVPESDKLTENRALKECVYYIETYSSHLTAIQFYKRHGMFPKAVIYILQEQCSNEVFLEGLLVPSIKEGQFGQLQEAMLRVDPSLVKWHPYLTASCRHVNRLGWSHILYQMQLFMKDFVRAAMTCIKFFQTGATSYSDLFERLHHVNRAKDHMTAVMDDKQWGSVPRPSPGSPSSRGWAGATAETNIRLTLTPSELTKHLNTISLQIEVTTFLHRHLGKNSLVPPTSPTQTSTQQAGLTRKQSVVGGGVQSSGLPTLFGNSMEKADVVHKVLLAGTTIQEGFQLAFKIIQDFRLAETKIYSRAGRRLSLLKKFNEVKLLLKCHKDTGLASKESCDEILDASVRALVGDKTQVKGAEELIKLMQGDTSKINAYILIGRLRQAYLLAVKGEREDDVRRIAMAAEQAEASGVKLKAICDQWLRDYEAKRRNAEQTKEVLARSRATRY